MRLTFGVGYDVCSAHLWLAPSLPSPTFYQDRAVKKFKIIFPIQNRPNDKTSRKLNCLALNISLIKNVVSLNIKIEVFLNVCMIQSGQLVFSP